MPVVLDGLHKIILHVAGAEAGRRDSLAALEILACLVTQHHVPAVIAFTSAGPPLFGELAEADVVKLAHPGLGGRLGVLVHRLNVAHRLALLSDADLLDVSRQQGQSGQGRRADGETLAGGGGGVAERIERVGALADFGLLAAHLGVAAGIVGDGAVGVGGQRDAERGQHADRGDSHAVKAQHEFVAAAGEDEGADDGNDDGQE